MCVKNICMGNILTIINMCDNEPMQDDENMQDVVNKQTNVLFKEPLALACQKQGNITEQFLSISMIMDMSEENTHDIILSNTLNLDLQCKCKCKCRYGDPYSYMCLAPTQPQKILVKIKGETIIKKLKYCKHFASCKLAKTTCKDSNMMVCIHESPNTKSVNCHNPLCDMSMYDESWHAGSWCDDPVQVRLLCSDLKYDDMINYSLYCDGLYHSNVFNDGMLDIC
jgi:hypothetical protein